MRARTGTTFAPLICTMLASWVLFSPARAVAQDMQGGPIAATNRIVTDLRDAREIVKAVPDQWTRERLELLLSRAELAARDLQQQAIAQQQLAQKPRPVAMPPADFARFLTALSGNSFDDGRLAIVKTLGTARLTAAQGKEILKKFAFDKGREDAAVFIYPLLVDPHLFSVTLEAMSFEKSRRDVMSRISR